MAHATPLTHSPDESGARAEPISSTIAAFGHQLIRYGLAVVIGWIGMMKFTGYEANGIQPLVAHSPFMGWIYHFLTVRQFSDGLGVFEVAVAILIAVRSWSPKASALGSALAALMFLTTLSFLLSTPGWEPSLGGFPFLSGAVGQFLIKDVVLLGAAIWSLGEALTQEGPTGVENRKKWTIWFMFQNPQSDAARWASFPMRILVGYGFIEHGFAKLSRGPDAFAAILRQIGVPLPHIAAWLTIGTELAGGLALLLGAFVVWASIPTAAVLLAAAVTVHLPYGFSSVKLLSVSASGARFGPVGYEVDLLYLAALITLVLQGPAPLSIDHLRQRRATTERGLKR